MEFQIKESYGKDCGSYSYFETKGNETIEELKKMAIDVVVADWKKENNAGYILHFPTPSRPTIEVAEYDSVKHQRVRNGIKFKTKWR